MLGMDTAADDKQPAREGFLERGKTLAWGQVFA
jgi:hypothetical protein